MHEQFSQQRVDNLALLCHRQSQALRLRQLEALQLILQLVCQWLLWQLQYQKRLVQFQGSACSTTRSNGSNLHKRNGYPLNFFCTASNFLCQVEISPQKMCLSICQILSGVKLTSWGHFFSLKTDFWEIVRIT